MPSAVFALPYFGSIHFYREVVKHNTICIEKHENFQKQTYRNRQYIYGANGKLMLNLPVKHSKSSTRKKYKACMLDNSFKWQELHFKSLETAYRTSPYFEFYEDDLLPLYQNKYHYVFDFNLECFRTALDLIGLDFDINFTNEYEEEITDNKKDCRHLINAKEEVDIKFDSYHQVFENKHGFIPNLSILDLIFNLGPESINYLKHQV
jgi:hypothetical protein